METRTVPTGSEVTLGSPRLSAAGPLLDALRRYVRREVAVSAVYGFSMGVGSATPADVLGIDLVLPGATGHGEEARLLDELAAALEPVVPFDTPIELAVLSESARLDVLRVVAPIGAGGRLEDAAAQAARDPSAVADLVRRLLEATVYVPALRGSADGHAAPDSSVQPRELRPGEAVRYPVTRMGAHLAIATFSSWPALLHADPPFPDQVALRGEALMATWPAEVALALDPGCVHAAVLPPDQCAALRAALAE